MIRTPAPDYDLPEWNDDPIHLKDFFDDEPFEQRRFDRSESQADYLEDENEL